MRILTAILSAKVSRATGFAPAASPPTNSSSPNFTIGDAYGTRVAEIIKSMKNGEISQPFQTEVGWHVLQLEDSRTKDKTDDMQRDQAKNMVFQRKAEDEYESFLRQIRSEAYVEIRLPGATAPAAPKAP